MDFRNGCSAAVRTDVMWSDMGTFEADRSGEESLHSAAIREASTIVLFELGHRRGPDGGESDVRVDRLVMRSPCPLSGVPEVPLHYVRLRDPGDEGREEGGDENVPSEVEGSFEGKAVLGWNYGKADQAHERLDAEGLTHDRPNHVLRSTSVFCSLEKGG